MQERVSTTVTGEQIRQWVADGSELSFYTGYDWKKKRREVLALDRYECQRCKARGKYVKATMVHHVRHLRDRPDLALCVWDVRPDGVKARQLISLCDDCHAEEHPERMKQYKPEMPVTEERW